MAAHEPVLVPQAKPVVLVVDDAMTSARPFLALLDQGVIDRLTSQQLTGETGAGQPPVVRGGTL